ncbi:Ankyrin repeat-containing protein [Massilia sp. CF038]|nr:Ankyrin repeat-containing protein [Massilia sp. CF038]
MSNLIQSARFIVLAAMVACTTSALAAPQDALIGAWCFYEQSDGGNTVKEKVDITFMPDRSYVWREGEFEQTGGWTLSDQVLEMSKVGKHTVVHLGASEMELKRGSTMRFKKGQCSKASFGDQDITQFHNAASTGDLGMLQTYLSKKIGTDVTDLSRGDTALIKAAKFCQVAAAQLLLKHGAALNIRNEEGKTALDYARSSSFHKGCDALVKVL